MSITTDPAVRDALLNLLVAEITRPSTNHVYDFIKTELGSSRPDFLGALLTAAIQDPTVAEIHSPDHEEEKYETLLSCSDADFSVMFRMSRSTLKNLVQMLENQVSASKDTDVAASVPIKKKVLLTCWLMGNTEEFSTAANIFGIRSDDVYPIFEQICTELCSLSGKFISWPSSEQCEPIKNYFEDQYGFPGVIGVIGFCHVKIKQPKTEAEFYQYLNEKSGVYTTILQAVCDDKMIFRNVCVGFPGRCRPSRVLVGSPLYGRLTSRTDPLIEPRKHILGSSAYPQLATLLTPYNNPVDEQQNKFNILHEKARSVVDKSFASMTTRFCRLKYVDVPQPDLASNVILAACVLHNFVLMHGDEFHMNSTAESSEGNKKEADDNGVFES